MNTYAREELMIYIYCPDGSLESNLPMQLHYIRHNKSVWADQEKPGLVLFKLHPILLFPQFQHSHFFSQYLHSMSLFTSKILNLERINYQWKLLNTQSIWHQLLFIFVSELSNKPGKIILILDKK